MILRDDHFLVEGVLGPRTLGRQQLREGVFVRRFVKPAGRPPRPSQYFGPIREADAAAHQKHIKSAAGRNTSAKKLIESVAGPHRSREKLIEFALRPNASEKKPIKSAAGRNVSAHGLVMSAPKLDRFPPGPVASGNGLHRFWRELMPSEPTYAESAAARNTCSRRVVGDASAAILTFRAPLRATVQDASAPQCQLFSLSVFSVSEFEVLLPRRVQPVRLSLRAGYSLRTRFSSAAG